jgi:DNA-binding XRE family transcriptional regulator
VRDFNHYHKMFTEAGTVGASLLARAIHTTRTGVDEMASRELVRAVTRRYGDPIEGQAAAAILADEASGGGSAQRIAGVIKARREELALTHADLAELAQISKRTAINMEQDDYNPSLETLERVCSALGMSVVDVLGQGE